MDAQNPFFKDVEGAVIEGMSGVTPVGAAALKQAAYVFGPIVRLLLAHGVTYQRVSEALKKVFIEEAERGAETRSERMTDSYLAVTTGIHRKEIRRLRSTQAQPVANAAGGAPQGLPAAVFTRWMADPAYCDAAGQPRPLPRYGNTERGFEDLVKSISTDVHPRTVLNELIRLELVSLEDDHVHLKVNAFVPNPDFAQMFAYMGANLHDHAAAAAHNVLADGPAFLEQSIYCDALPPDAVKELDALARREWTHILKKVVPEVARHEAGKPDDSATGAERAGPSVRMRIGMYFYAEGNYPTAPPLPTISPR
jgi:hypothetical protein